MKIDTLAWNLYLSEREFIKHHENQRTTASNILAAIAAGLLVSLGTNQLTIEIRILISFLLAAIGLFGYVFCWKLYALIMLHADRSYEYLDVLSVGFKELKIEEIKNNAKQANQKKFKFYGKIGLHTIWNWFHLFIFFMGLILVGVHLFMFFYFKY
jgi:hypothetical protein